MMMEQVLEKIEELRAAQIVTLNQLNRILD